MGLFTLFHLTLGPHKFKHPITCHHASESLVTHSHKDPQSQLHMLSHSLTVSHAPANVAMHSHKDASHTVANIQFHTQPHTTITQPLTIIYPLIYSSNMVPLSHKDIQCHLCCTSQLQGHRVSYTPGYGVAGSHTCERFTQ